MSPALPQNYEDEEIQPSVVQPQSVAGSIAALQQSVVNGGTAPAPLTPPAPETLDETGISPTIVEQIIFKLLYFRGEILGRDLATALGLKFSVIESLVENMKRQHAIQVKRSLGMGNTSAIYALTEAGRILAREALDNNHYSGAVPVPLSQYASMVKHQRRKDGWLTPEALGKAYSRMVVTPRILAQIGPAVSSGNSFLIYGQPGNGKTFLAEALANVDDTTIYIPLAIESQGNIIQLYDPIYHHRVDDAEEPSIFSSEPKHDQRWVRCRRPFIVTGGELTLGMLDLSYNAVSKVYDAPYQLKANNGIYLIDDFGRQRVTPAEVLNRWIVPMERRVDYLSFLSGAKMTVPFEAFLIFSTNLRPEQLGDEAFLRRIQYKMLLRSPEEKEFVEIFTNFCQARQLPFDPATLDTFLSRRYRITGKRMRRCHPRDILSHAIDLIHFEKLPFALTEKVLEEAFDGCFVEDTED